MNMATNTVMSTAISNPATHSKRTMDMELNDLIQRAEDQAGNITGIHPSLTPRFPTQNTIMWEWLGLPARVPFF